MNVYLKLMLFVLTALLSGTSFASADFSWESPAGDKSIDFLRQVFGSIGTVLVSDQTTVIGTAMNYFNLAVISLGSIVVGYTSIVAAINTAQEGEVLGKRWSTLWIPFRIIVGVGLLVPAPNYSLLQILFMQITLLGVHAANQIWQVAIGTFNTLGMSSSVSVGHESDLKNISKHLFHGLVCAELWNNDYAGVLPAEVQPYVDYTDNKLYIGIAGDPDYKNICGGVEPAPTPRIALDTDSWNSANLAAFEGAVSILQPAAVLAAEGGSGDASPGVTLSAAQAMYYGISNAPKTITDGSNLAEQNVTSATNDGWIIAGSFYFLLVDSGSNSQNVTLPSPTEVAANLDNRIVGDLGERIYNVDSRLISNRYDIASTSAAPEYEPSNPSEVTGRLELSEPSGVGSEGGNFVKEITSPLRKLAYAFMNHLTERNDDPVTSVRNVGSEIVTTIEAIWFALIILSFIVLTATCIMSAMQPACFALGSIICVFIPIASLLLGLLWSIGITLALYIPMIPYLVFSFTALAWFILVIEGILAAPVVALGLVSPAGETLGKASPAVLLITGVFLKPSLMIVGMVGSILLVRTIVAMINYSFAATVEAVIAGIGVFGVIALITLYGGLILAVFHECFSLIYVLPDRIMRWIGAHADQMEQSKGGELSKQMEASTEKGAAVGENIMKGGLSLAGSYASSQMSKGAKKPDDKGKKKDQKEEKPKEGQEGQKSDLGGEQAGGSGGAPPGGMPGGGTPGGGGMPGGGMPGGGMPGGGMPGGGAMPGGT